MSNRVLVVILSALVMGLGVVLGWFGSQVLTEPTVITTELQVEEKEQELTEEELARLCAGNVQEHKDGILDLQKKVK